MALPTTTNLTRIYNAALLLLDCACEALDLTELKCPTRRCVVPGDAPEDVNCCEGVAGGQLTVNALNVFPSRNFPIAFGGEMANCVVPYDVVSYSVQVLRCSPVGTSERAPSCDALDDVAYRTLVDMQAVRSGLTCCLQDRARVEAVVGGGYRWSYGDHLTVGPRGGCVGSQLIVFVGLPTCVECT